MTNKKLIEVYNGLVGLTNLKGVKFNYAVAKNINILEKEVEILKATTKETEEFKKYDAERIELCKKHAKKDEKGEAMLLGGKYDIEDMEAFTVEFDALKETHKAALDERKAQLEGFDALLEAENTSVSLFKIDISEVPEEVTTSQMGVIYPIINE